MQLLTLLENQSSNFVHSIKPVIFFLFPLPMLIWHSIQVKHRCCLPSLHQFWFHLQESSVHPEFIVFQFMEQVCALEAPSGFCFCWCHFTTQGTCVLCLKLWDRWRLSIHIGSIYCTDNKVIQLWGWSTAFYKYVLTSPAMKQWPAGL